MATATGVPYHTRLGDIAAHWRDMVKSLYDYLELMGHSLPFSRDAYLNCINLICKKRMIAKVLYPITMPTHRLQHHTIDNQWWRYRVFANCAVDIYTGHVFSADYMNANRLVGYKCMPTTSVEGAVLDVLQNVSAVIDNGFDTEDPVSQFRRLRAQIVALVDDTVLAHWWAFQGYTEPTPSDPRSIRLGDIESELFSMGMYHCGNLQGAPWIGSDRGFNLGLLPAYLSGVSGTGNNTLHQELTACDEKNAIWYVDITRRSANLRHHRTMFGTRVGIAWQPETTAGRLDVLDSRMITGAAKRTVCCGVNQPSKRLTFIQAVPPLIFFFAKMPAGSSVLTMMGT